MAHQVELRRVAENLPQTGDERRPLPYMDAAGARRAQPRTGTPGRAPGHAFGLRQSGGKPGAWPLHDKSPGRPLARDSAGAGKTGSREVYAPEPYRLQAKVLLTPSRPKEAFAAAEQACADPHSVPADKFVRLCARAAVGEKDRALAELELLRPQFAGTRPFAEAIAELKRLGVAVR
jgi:hypothetical protein